MVTTMSDTGVKKLLQAPYTVDAESTFWTFVRYTLTGTVFMGCCQLSRFMGVHPLWLVPFFSLIATLKVRKHDKRNLRKDMVRALLSSEDKILARVDDLPRWMVYPDMERAEWINKVIVRMWPNICHYIRNLLVTTIQPSVAQYVPAFKFESVHIGDIAPRVGGVKVYEENVPRNEIILDMELIYQGDCNIDCSVKGLKAGIKDIEFSGTIRIILSPLLKEIPLIGAVQAFFLNPPFIDFNLTNIGDVLDFPGLSDILRSQIDSVVSSILVLPNKYIYQMVTDIPKASIMMPRPRGVLRIFVVEAKNLEKKDIGVLGMGKSDPFVEVTVGSQKHKTKHIDNTVSPVWNFCCEVVVDSLEQEMNFRVFDRDEGPSGDDAMGSEIVEIKPLAVQGESDMWLDLKEVKKGQLHIKTSWKNLTSSLDDLKAEEERVRDLQKWSGGDRSTGLLLILLDSAENLPRCSFRRSTWSSSGRTSLDPDPKVIFNVEGKTKESYVKYRTTNPLFDECFTFWVHNVHKDTLKLQVTNSKNQVVIGEGIVQINELLKEDNLEMLPKVVHLKGATGATVTLYLQLRILKSGKYGDLEDDTVEGPSMAPPMKEAEIEKLIDQTPVDSREKDLLLELQLEEQIVPSRVHMLGASRSDDVKKQPTPSRETVDDLLSGPVQEPVVKTAAPSREMPVAPRSSITEMKGVGEVELTLRYTAIKNELVVVIHKARNLPMEDENELPDPYVKLYLLPDKDKRSKKKTGAVVDCCDPVYDEKIEYSVRPHDMANRTLLVMVVSKKKTYHIFKKSPIIGEARIEINSHQDFLKPITKWWPLYPALEGEE